MKNIDKTDCLTKSRKIAKRLNREGNNKFYGSDFYYQLLEKHGLR